MINLLKRGLTKSKSNLYRKCADVHKDFMTKYRARKLMHGINAEYEAYEV